MPQKFRVSAQATKDMDAIWDDVFDQSLSLAVADKVLWKLYEAFDLLGEVPQAGHLRQDLTDKPLKFWSVRRWGLKPLLASASPRCHAKQANYQS